MLSNAYFLAKFRFDTAENEPAKNLQNVRKMHFRKMHFSKIDWVGGGQLCGTPQDLHADSKVIIQDFEGVLLRRDGDITLPRVLL